MNLKDSVIVTTTLTRLYPAVVLFSLYLMSYGTAFPGGGFQGGVILGTMIVVTEAALERRLYADSLFRRIELLGVLLLSSILVAGWIVGGYPFGAGYAWTTPSFTPGNILIWLIGCAIYLEVSGSMILIFRRFLFWETTVTPTAGPAAPVGRDAGLKAATLLVLALLGLALFVLVPPLELVFHDEVDAFRRLTLELGIRNMVTTVYLGPRVIDTLLEVMVVLLTVFGRQTMGGSH